MGWYSNLFNKKPDILPRKVIMYLIDKHIDIDTYYKMTRDQQLNIETKAEKHNKEIPKRVNKTYRFFAKYVPGTRAHNTKEWMKYLGNTRLSSLEMYLDDIHLSVDEFKNKTLNDKKQIIHNAQSKYPSKIYGPDNNPDYQDNYPENNLYVRHILGSQNKLQVETIDKLDTVSTRPRRGGSCRTQKRARRNRRATARFFVRGK